MKLPAAVLPSGHRVVRRLPVPGGGWFVIHPALPGRSWLLRPVSTTPNPRHPGPIQPLLAVPLLRIPLSAHEPAAVGELFALDGARVLAEVPVPWPTEEVRRFVRDLRPIAASMAAFGGGNGAVLRYERLLWHPRDHRIEVLPQAEAEQAAPTGAVIERLLHQLLPASNPPPTQLLEGMRIGRIPVDTALATLAGKPAVSSTRPLVEIAGFSANGPTRARSEDAIGWATRPDGTTMVVVAHGWGGWQSAAWASRAAVEEMLDTLHAEDGPPEGVLREALARARSALRGDGPHGERDAGVTLAAAVIGLPPGEERRWNTSYPVWIGHIGDVRAYRRHSLGTSPLTRDHTLGAHMVAQGKWAAEQAKTHHQAHIVMRSFQCAAEPAADAEQAQPEIVETTLDWPSDRLLLCTRSVWERHDDAALHALLAPHQPRIAASRLLASVVESEPTSNASAIVIARC